ncbi:VTC domain-containing protein [Micrococcales bacterium KH10]|nr:VTC domain-containing protein [Micrococcales bacterium KH10]
MTVTTQPHSLALADVASQFEPIDLVELNATAALQHRVDRKYIVTAAAAADLVGWIARSAGESTRPRVLQVGEQRWSDYESTYFDTPELRCYRMALQQHRHRFKVRTRTYSETGSSFLEVKTKSPHGHTVKRRMAWQDTRPQSVITSRGLDFISACLSSPSVGSLDLAPSLVTAYKRLTLHLPQSKARMTIDANLKWQAPNQAGIYETDRLIIEIKSSRSPTPVDHWLWRAGHRPVPSSKYAAGIALFHSDLPRHRWSRTVIRDLGRPELIHYG